MHHNFFFFNFAIFRIRYILYYICIYALNRCKKVMCLTPWATFFILCLKLLTFPFANFGRLFLWFFKLLFLFPIFPSLKVCIEIPTQLALIWFHLACFVAFTIHHSPFCWLYIYIHCPWLECVQKFTRVQECNAAVVIITLPGSHFSFAFILQHNCFSISTNVIVVWLYEPFAWIFCFLLLLFSICTFFQFHSLLNWLDYAVCHCPQTLCSGVVVTANPNHPLPLLIARSQTRQHALVALAAYLNGLCSMTHCYLLIPFGCIVKCKYFCRFAVDYWRTVILFVVIF